MSPSGLLLEILSLPQLSMKWMAVTEAATHAAVSHAAAGHGGSSAEGLAGGRGHASSSDLHQMLVDSSHTFGLSLTHHVMMATSAAVLITMTLALVRAMAGPTVFDRVLALNMFGTKTVLLICVVSFVTTRTDFLDLALLYSLMNFIGMVALLRFTQYRSFGEEPA
ncbi:monovalent cation/H+ antiporter complex subunit F [Rhodopirellula sp. JC740]|uniref:Monovalent cation/H+ antiporter complex subunit F n=1 Tax=Rhodopirellula halodulae TaxID=2894198 RepID=A0ABS8NF47_9BACT|nr:monovalent cation/H+ antiporter complex subunit F [Rhodopirellula sp. JC740]MCC9642179.1 monovalent cation/H+ antiporter complex subunit F [Rhodopirellula sp. JC740]